MKASDAYSYTVYWTAFSFDHKYKVFIPHKDIENLTFIFLILNLLHAVFSNFWELLHTFYSAPRL